MSIKDFTIYAQLGKGAYSSVYKVQRTIDQQYYALKKVKLLNLSEKQLQNALNQVRILASIHHPNIVSYKDAFLQGKNLCIIMQYMDNGDLYQSITQHKKRNVFYSQNQIWNVIIQSVKGLKKLHDMKIFHRDMKSANIFLNKKNEAKLGDLNVSKIAKQGLLYTQTGTPYYASPQVWNQKPYDNKSDIWSLGVVIYQMTALNVPFQAEDMEGLANAIVKGKFPPIPKNYSEQLWRVISLMLELNPTKRPSAQKLLKSALFKKKGKQIGLQDFEDQTDDLLSTIKIPKKLNYLTDRLPGSNYQTVNRGISRSVSQKRNQVNRYSNHLSMNKANFPKIDKILKQHQKIIEERKRNGQERSLLHIHHHQQDKNNLQNNESYSKQKLKDMRAPPLPMNRKEVLQRELKKIQDGKHEVQSNSRHRNY